MVIRRRRFGGRGFHRGLGERGRRGCGMDRRGLLPGAPQGIVLDLLDPVDDVGDAFVDPLPHQVERPHPLSLVLHLRVDLRVAPQADARPEVIHGEEVVLPGVVEELEEHGPLHPLHLVAGIVAAGVAPATRLGEDKPELVEIVRLEIGGLQFGIEALACPGEQAIAIEGP